MRFILVILSIVLASEVSLAQADSSFTLIRSYKGDITDAALDNLGNLYIVSSTGQVRKFNQSGDSVAIYNQVRNYGKLFTIDVSNPLKILLFYKDYSSVVVLDRFLASIVTVNLKNFSILQPAAVGLSYDNNIWVFDEYDSKLKKLDEQGNRLLESADFRSALNASISPQRILNDNGFVYLADTASGVFVFDNYGSFKRKVPLMNWQSIAVNRNNIISTKNEIITIFNSNTLLQSQKKNPFFAPYVHSFVSADKFISFSPHNLAVYQIRY